MRHLISRLLQGMATFLCVLIASFHLMKVAPGSPWSAERALSPEAMQALESKHAMHLGPFLERVLLHADFGPSWKHPDQSVRDILFQALPVSLELGAWALALALLVGIPAGLFAAAHAGRWGDRLSMGIVLVGVVVPSFVIAPLLQEWIGLRIGVVAGWEGPWSRVLPVFCASLATTTWVARMLRAGLLDVLSEEHIRTARAKGLSESVILLRHALPAALVPVVQMLAPAAAGLLTGTLVIEQVFQVPGLGRHFVQSALQRDFPLALGTLCLYCLLLLLLNALADMATWLLDVRTRSRP
ncbi:MAG: oligopeptide transporter permease [Fibrobacterota bacterium]|jgi:oligopeptide transport system permease protein